MRRGESVHGESITDGAANGGIAVTLFKGGSLVTRTLKVNEILYVTDVRIFCEDGADVSLCADGKVAGEYLVHGTVAAKGSIIIHFEQPFACVKGTGLTFYGAGANLNTCIIDGFITSA